MRTTIKSFVLAALLVSPCFADDDPTQAYIERQSFVETVPLSDVAALLDQPKALEPFLDWEWPEEVIKHPAVTRNDDQLTVRFAKYHPLILKDIVIESTDEAEGDAQRYEYLASTAQFHIFAVYFQHDQPGFLLVKQTGEKTYYVNTHE